jgi:hypothetical protein
VSYARFGSALGAISEDCRNIGFVDTMYHSANWPISAGLAGAINKCKEISGGIIQTKADVMASTVEYFCCCGAKKDWVGDVCTCPQGTMPDEVGACVSVLGDKPPLPPVTLQICKPDEKWSDAANACVVASCPTGQVWDSGAWACLPATSVPKGLTVVQPKGGGTPYVSRPPATPPPAPFLAAGMATRAAPWAIGAMFGLAAAIALGTRRA